MELKIGQIFLKVRPFRNRVFEYEIKNLTLTHAYMKNLTTGRYINFRIKDFEGYFYQKEGMVK
jgi:hypothetical protein